MKMLGVMTVAATCLVMMTPLFAQAQSSQEINRQILEKLTRLEDRFTQVETRLTQVETRLTRLEARVDEGQKALSTRIDDLRGLIYVILAGMFALVGFIIWDRITTIDPVLKQTTELEDNKDAVWKVLKEYAKREPRFAEVLNSRDIIELRMKS